MPILKHAPNTASLLLLTWLLRGENRSNDSNVLRWAAYNADTVPVVSPVSDGYRISIIFDIVGVETTTDGTNNKVSKPPRFVWEHPQGVIRDSVVLGTPNFTQSEPLLAFFASSLREVFEKDEHVFFGLLLQEDYAGSEVDEEVRGSESFIVMTVVIKGVCSIRYSVRIQTLFSARVLK